MRVQRRTAAFTAALALTGLIATSIAAAPAQAGNPNSARKLADAVTTQGVMRHLEALQGIADANDGNRGAGTSGYEASGAYVEQQLRAAGYSPQRQYFDFFYEEVHATSLTEVAPGSGPIENNPMSYSQGTGPGGVTGELASPAVNVQGCDAAAYGGANLTGKIALVSRGTCSFAQKAQVAHQVGAAAIIVYNNAAGALNGTLGGVDPATAPATGVTQATGQSLLAKMANGPVTVKFVLDKSMETRQTFNITAETKTGDPNNVVMMGAHLDGVHDGPGINDNGSGTASILETAIQLGKANKVNNKVRFAWWGAEELGLLGSEHYVYDLAENNPAELAKIATYLNYDMVASPNYIIGVYDANESTYTAPVDVPEGSIQTEKILTDYFDSIGQPWVDTAFSGRSDYAAFIELGVASSGLFTGADGSKTADEVAKFGGTEGIMYDPNYHTPQDDINNVNAEALGIMSKAIAFSTGTLAYDTSMINGKRSAGKSGKPHPTKGTQIAPDEAAA
ncbi:MAG: M28 family peptidase [Actinobacteria bacterium]|nr:M28 family peptidase [Actinomycetota bacterium]